jgi:hypothetical protein
LARYNPKNKQHRKNLAKRIAKMLLSSGFSLEGNTTGEDVYVRAVTPVAKGTAQVRVLTSILNGEMRLKDKDAIRVCAVYTDETGASRGLVKSTRINRVGDMDAITGRLLEAMRKTYGTARKRANDQGFLSLPVQPSKKRWVPRKKKAGSKRTSARSLNTAVKAATKKPVAMPTYPTFKVGDLVVGVGTRASVKGLVKAVANVPCDSPRDQPDGPVVTVFWFDRMQDVRERARFLKHVAA